MEPDDQRDRNPPPHAQRPSERLLDLEKLDAVLGDRPPRTGGNRLAKHSIENALTTPEPHESVDEPVHQRPVPAVSLEVVDACGGRAVSHVE